MNYGRTIELDPNRLTELVDSPDEDRYITDVSGRTGFAPYGSLASPKRKHRSGAIPTLT